MEIQFSLKLFKRIQVGLVTTILGLGTLAYLIRHITGHQMVLGLIPLLDVGRESSLPTYFSTLNLLVAALLTFLVYGLEKGQAMKTARYWLLLALVFVYLSIDEGATIHENFSNLSRFFGAQGGLFEPQHGWLPFGLVMAVVAAIAFAPFLRGLPRPAAGAFMLAGGLYALGAIGFEIIGSLMLRAGISSDSLIYDLRRVLEEGLEMYAIVLFNCAAFQVLVNRHAAFGITFTDTPNPRGNRPG